MEQPKKLDPKNSYLGNPNLKRERVAIEWTPELFAEYKKCAEDPIYFAEQYIQVVHVDHGFIPIRLYDYQKEIIEKFNNNRRTIVATSRQAGKCVHADTMVKIRNKTTGEIVEMRVEDFHNLQKPKLTYKELFIQILKESEEHKYIRDCPSLIANKEFIEKHPHFKLFGQSRPGFRNLILVEEHGFEHCFLLCDECGKPYQSLANHFKQAHKDKEFKSEKSSSDYWLEQNKLGLCKDFITEILNASR